MNSNPVDDFRPYRHLAKNHFTYTQQYLCARCGHPKSDHPCRGCAIFCEEPKMNMEQEEILGMPAGAKMNQLIWWKIFDMTPTPPNNDLSFLPDYSGDMNCAKAVADKMKTFVLVRTEYKGIEYCCNHIAFAETAPLAICRAALLENYNLANYGGV